MNDISWHYLNEDYSWNLLSRYPLNRVLVETEIGFHIDRAEYIEDRPSGPYLATACEKAIRFAFFE